MCRSIKKLRSIEPAATPEDVEAAALQFVRKISGFRQPSKVNLRAFDFAVSGIARVSQTLLDDLIVRGQARS
ncbi:MAG: DUF2277 domain-containing protein [Acidobacteria bacterium]|nr:DUF2277 domain-containing protein [Acidobacteriota bacterium]MCH8985973.1 DUF2277 domain-containing protein [Acidobacteriota bacterium]